MAGVGTEVFEDGRRWVIGGAWDEFHECPVAEALVDVQDRCVAIARDLDGGGTGKSENFNGGCFGAERGLKGKKADDKNQVNTALSGQELSSFGKQIRSCTGSLANGAWACFVPRNTNSKQVVNSRESSEFDDQRL